MFEKFENDYKKINSLRKLDIVYWASTVSLILILGIICYILKLNFLWIFSIAIFSIIIVVLISAYLYYLYINKKQLKNRHLKKDLLLFSKETYNYEKEEFSKLLKKYSLENTENLRIFISHYQKANRNNRNKTGYLSVVTSLLAIISFCYTDNDFSSANRVNIVFLLLTLLLFIIFMKTAFKVMINLFRGHDYFKDINLEKTLEALLCEEYIKLNEKKKCG